jgi:hypothetical protein
MLIMKQIIRLRNLSVLASITLLSLVFVAIPAYAAQESGSLGLEGKISAPPPTTPATISFPRDGAVINDLPVTVTGICPNGLLVKLFKNNVFAGSAQCTNGNFSIQIDLFSGRNELVARVYDDLDQAGPDSNVVTVTFPFTGFSTGSRISLTSSFAKKGANPGQKLTWPITLSGGSGPYAISVDWGDGKKPDLISQPFPGTFNIEHVYDQPGIYNVVVRATDKDNNVAFLQLVGVANGPLNQSTGGTGSDDGGQPTKQKVKILWQPAAISIPLIFSTFWLGRRYELFTLRRRLEQREDIR